MPIAFEWDPDKAEINERKHGISFALARRVFYDPLALSDQDRIEGHEQRWRTIGQVGQSVILVVAHTFRDEDDVEVIRIISARRAEPRERRKYRRQPR